MDDIEMLTHNVEDLVSEFRKLWHDVRRLEGRVQQLGAARAGDP